MMQRVLEAWTLTDARTVFPPPDPTPSAPVGLQPSGQQTVGSLRPTLTWNTSANALAYDVEVSTDSRFVHDVKRYTTSSTSITLGSDLYSRWTYYWRVRASRNRIASGWSGSAVFKTSSPAPAACTNRAQLLSESDPFGKTVSPGGFATKSWQIKNVGTCTWSNYRLIHTLGDRMGSPSFVTVGQARPGEVVQVQVRLQALFLVGIYRGQWTLRTSQGVSVANGVVHGRLNAVGSRYGRPGAALDDDHVAFFDVDPPSPSAADTVRISARVSPWTEYRRMRVLVDDRVVGESSNTEATFTWHPGAADPGEHAIVLELADQTDTAWADPERRVLTYTTTGAPSPVNHAPNRPIPVADPAHDYYVYYAGNTARLCAQSTGDADGDAVNEYAFETVNSPQTWASGWVSSSCVTTAPLGPYTYTWRAKARDARGAESAWTDPWHFTIVNPNLSITALSAAAQDPTAEVVRIDACTAGQGGVGITMRVDVNDAPDGSGTGTWHRIKELGVPCFSAPDAPIWRTLDFPDGPHRIRVEAHGQSTGWDGAAAREATFTLPPRRPAEPRLISPVPPGGAYQGTAYVADRSVTFRWKPTLRATGYILSVGTTQSPEQEPSPIFRAALSGATLEHALTLSQDYPLIYWKLQATNTLGVTDTPAQALGVDRRAPTCTVASIPSPSTTTGVQVGWSGGDQAAGVVAYDLQRIDVGRGDWADWLSNVPVATSSATFIGESGQTYGFRCRARDGVGNLGAYGSTPDAVVRIDLGATPGAGQPQLAVAAVRAHPNPEGGFVAEVVVENRGTRGSDNGFITDVYLDRQPSGPGDLTASVAALATEPIPAGGSVTLTTELALPPPAQGGGDPRESSHVVYVQADSGGAVRGAGSGGVISVPIAVCIAAPDSLEADSAAAPRPLAVNGSPLRRNLHTMSDEDWHVVDVRAGYRYTFKAPVAGDIGDTVLHLYQADGETVLDMNDDGDGQLGAVIEWTAPSAGRVYLKVTSASDLATGCGTIYDIAAVEAPPLPPDPAPCAPRPNVQLVARNAGSGRLRVELAASPGLATPDNRVTAISFTPPPNARVQIDSADGQPFTVGTSRGQQRLTTYLSEPEPFTISLDGGPPVIHVVRTGPGAVTVNMVIDDACGSWPTFVGGGPSAF